MITRVSREGLLCFHQLDHASLSGEFARHWGGGSFPAMDPHESVIYGIAHHDIGWPDIDSEPRYDSATGRPHTYQTHARQEALGVAERSVSRVAAIDPYAGWLVSRHFCSFHDRSEDADAIAWVAEQRQRRQTMVDPTASNGLNLEANFDWLQLMDSLSLAACNDWSRWESRLLARDYEGGRTRFRYNRSAPDVSPALTVRGWVDPYPFDRSPLAKQIPARLLDGVHWSSLESLLQAWRTGHEVTVEVTLEAG